MNKNFNLSLIYLAFIMVCGCEQENATPSSSNNPGNPSGTINVYSDFFCNGLQYGVTRNIDPTQISMWYFDQNHNGLNSDQISLIWKNPLTNQEYAGFFIESPDGSPFHLGLNPNCTMGLGGGSFTYTSINVTVNITKIATSINDTFEGTFSGDYLYVTSNPITSNEYPGYGSFKVPLKDL